MEMREKVIDILSVHSNLENANQYLHENDDLSKLRMNSILFIKMVVTLESEFCFEFEDEALDYNKFTSLNLLCNYVEEQMRLNNVTYSNDESKKSYSEIKKELVKLLSKRLSDPIITQPSFKNLLDLNLSTDQVEDLLFGIKVQFNVDLDIDCITHKNLFLIDDLCKYIYDNI